MTLRRVLPIVLIGLMLFGATGGVLAQDQGPAASTVLPGTGFSYSGELTNGGTLVTATCEFQFSLFDALNDGTQLGSTQTLSGVSVANGRFSITLNEGGQFGVSAFNGSARWLAISVQYPPDAGYTALSPRQSLLPTPLALALPGLRTEQNATSPNVIGGYTGNAVTGGAVGSTIAGGGVALQANSVTASYGTVSGGFGNDTTGNYGAIGGGTGNEAKYYAVVAGGWSNTASGNYATVAGGQDNTASGQTANVGGGTDNTASGTYAVVGGGGSNLASATYATVAGGQQNVASSDWATVAGGYANEADHSYAFVGGGAYNNATGIYSTVGGGISNTASTYGAVVVGGGWDGTDFGRNVASGPASLVGGGISNTASADWAVVTGGWDNWAAGDGSVIGGGALNEAEAEAEYATIAGGYRNYVSYPYATVGGGIGNAAVGVGATVAGGGYFGFNNGNVASGIASTISGGRSNDVASHYGTIGGGENNLVIEDHATIGGGWGNTADGASAVVAGGYQNYADGDVSTVAGGSGNFANATFSSVGGGYDNLAAAHHTTVGGGESNSANFIGATVAGGNDNTASGTSLGHSTVGGGQNNIAGGDYATVPGGVNNRANGAGSVAMGANAHALHFGSFVFADVVTSTVLATTGGNQFLVRAVGGVNFYSNVGLTTGCFLASGGVAWSCVSDRNQKENFAPVDGVAVLNTLMGLPIETWNAQSQDAAIRHMGPMAQDWYAAFGLGEGETTITGVDADGVALAAIQGLYTVVEEKEERIDALEARLAVLEAEVETPKRDASDTAQLALVVGLVAGAGIAGGAFVLGLKGVGRRAQRVVRRAAPRRKLRTRGASSRMAYPGRAAPSKGVSS